MSTVRIHYHRPGKELTIYEEDLIRVDETQLVTFKILPPAISAHLGEALQKQGFITPEQCVHSIRKVYHFHEKFNVLEFRDPANQLLGHYSDIGMPLEPFGDDYAMIDLFLDLWRYPNGQILELDWDELEAAQQNQLISPAQAEVARSTLARLVAEAASGIYPHQYLARASQI
jgi:predicted RNA-binding protein associated with RNAse of E/G family